MNTDIQPRERHIRFNVWVGMLLSAVLMVLKMTVGFLFNSRALIADGLHSLTDFSTDIVILFGSRYWSQPPDAEHPYGHRRIETVISMSIGLVLLLAGAWMVGKALWTLLSGAESVAPGWPVFVIALMSIISKEWLYRWTTRAARKTQSVALQANAWHHRTDALSSIPVAIVVCIAYFRPNWAWLDCVGAFIVALFLIQAAYRIIRTALNELLEFGAPKRLRKNIEALARSIPGVKDVHGLRSRYVGSSLFVDLHVQVDPNMTVRDGHEITSKVCDAIHVATKEVSEVLVHLEPYKGNKK